MPEKDRISNKYVRDYYNKTVGDMSGGYTKNRWFSTSVGEFDYRQTERALHKALEGLNVKLAIEIGPGDAVWTETVKKHVSSHMHLIDQSDEMLAQAKEKLSGRNDVTFERSDYLQSEERKDVDLIVSSRCFEYFEDKKSSVEKMFRTLNSGGTLILITKNSKLYTSKSAQTKKVHSDQLSKNQVLALLRGAGFEVKKVYPAVMRWKVKYAPMRLIFDLLHKLSVATSGLFKIPFLEIRATESYTYVASKPKS